MYFTWIGTDDPSLPDYVKEVFDVTLTMGC